MLEFLMMGAQRPLNASGATCLLHMDGAIGSTSVVDTAGNFTFSKSGGSSSIVSGGQFGQCLSLLGNSYYSAPYHTLMNLSTRDFTIEAWVFLRSSSMTTPIFSRTIFSSGGYSYAFMLNTGRLEFYWINAANGSTSRFVSSIYVPLNQLCHVAVSRIGSTVRTFINGQLVGSLGIGNIAASTYPLYIGGDTSGYFGNFNIDEVRFINGTGLYLNNFTPPTAPF